MNTLLKLLRQIEPGKLKRCVGSGLLDRISGLIKEEVKRL